ncbi:MAG TPA: serine hydrolase domain-containing protein [Caulobacteraceae bacterium]|jgi:CubicO group peptidase (beta-lactamase class C family)|nr:serine hydrolase domain-containing protein [Caulobacteraceae bacterium]
MTDAPAAEEKPKTVEEQIDALFAPWNRSDAPGMAVGVVKDGKTLFRRGYGMASLETRVAIAPTTRLRIGSTSKHFTGLLALLLQEDGKLDLDAPIRTYVPELTGPGGEPSVRQLLQHRGGSRCYLDVGFVMHGMLAPPVGEALRVQARQTGRNFAPGAAMIYNNGGYHMVSIAIERVGGAPFEEQLKTRLFDPLGMAETLSLPSDHIITPGMAAMHVPSPAGGWRRGLFPSEEVRGEGAIVSTIDDMLRWTSHLRTRDKVGSKESWRQLTELPTYADGSKGHYALGLMFEDYRGLPTMHHAGGVIGGSSQMLTFPDHGLDVVILVNGALAANPLRLAEQIADIVLADQLAPEAEKIESKAHEGLLGRWWSPDSGITYDFLDEAGELKIGVGGMPQGSKLRAAGEGRFASPPMSIGEIAIDATDAANGTVKISFGGETASYRKVEKAETLDDGFVRSIEGRYASVDGGGIAEIRREDDKLMVRFNDQPGSIEIELAPFAGVDAASTTTMRPDAMHFTVLNFDREGGEGSAAKGFTLNSMRTRNLDFVRA